MIWVMINDEEDSDLMNIMMNLFLTFSDLDQAIKFMCVS